MSVLLIFEIRETNVALFLKAHFLSYASLFEFVPVIVPLTTIYASLNLIVALCFKSYLFAWFVSIFSTT